MAFITYPLNGVEYFAEDAETYLCTRMSGVYSAENNFALSIRSGMNVSISPGIAWIKDGDFSGKSVVSTEAVSLSIPLTDGVLGRKDRIVLRFDKGTNSSSIVLKQGTPSSAPTAPSVDRTSTVYELGLYIVDIPKSASSLNSKNISNTMLDENVCGLMRDGVTGIPTADLKAEATAIIEEIRETLESVVSQTVPKHSSTHRAGGTDAISPSDIGAAEEITEKSLTGSVTVTLEDNTVYRCTSVSKLTMSVGNVNCSGLVTFGTTVSSVSVSGYSGTGGDDVTKAKARETWEFNCFKGYILWKNWSA